MKTARDAPALGTYEIQTAARLDFRRQRDSRRATGVGDWATVTNAPTPRLLPVTCTRSISPLPARYIRPPSDPAGIQSTRSGEGGHIVRLAPFRGKTTRT